MINHFLPGLKCLRIDMEHLSPEHEVSSSVTESEIKMAMKVEMSRYLKLEVKKSYS